MTQSHVARLHPDDVPLWLAVELAAGRLVVAAKLKQWPSEIVPMQPKHVGVYCGRVTWPDQKIRVELSLRKNWSPSKGFGARFQTHELLDTIAHEIAHVSAGHRADHGPKFFLEFARMIVLSEQIGLRRLLQNLG